jgi:hypothetical protein
MPVSTDVLNSTLQDLKGPLLMSFEEKVPLFNWLKKASRTSSEKGTWIQRLLMGGSPTSGIALRNGGETFDTTRTEQVQKILIGTQRFGCAIAIPGLDLEINDGKLGAIKLIKEYPAAVIAAMAIDLDRYFLTGVSNGRFLATSECQGWNTLNGEKVNATGITGVTNGLIDFAATTLQTETVQSLPKSTAYNYVNQYGNIVGGWAAAGRKTTTKTYRQCARYNTSGPDKGPDIMFADDDTYANIETEDRTLVRTEYVQSDIDKGIAGLHRRFLNADLVAAQNLILTDFTTAPVNGLIYLLTSSGFEKIDYKTFDISNFEDRIANQDNVVAKGLGQFALICPNMAVQGAVTGGANP